MKKFHIFHIVEPSPWPIIASISALSVTYSTAIWANYSSWNIILPIGLVIAIITIFCWTHDIFSEASTQGEHSKKAEKALKTGIILFITSEVFLFISFFWAFFQRRLAPNVEEGVNWPPKSINPFNPIEVPILNTILLVSSGASITWSHHAIHANKIKEIFLTLLVTIILGGTFTIFQAIEYWNAEFTITDSTYGCSFFIATGFHGLHVLIGSTFLAICLIQIKKITISNNKFIRFEAAAWYWHFVDVVWLFLLISIYWWGSYSFSIKSTYDFHS